MLAALPWPSSQQFSTNVYGRVPLSMIRQANLIVPRVYLSDYYTACNPQEISRLGITHVISILDLLPDIPSSVPGENRLHIPIADRPDVDILVHLERTTQFMREALEADEENKVLGSAAVPQ
ncbi:hypothetical protein D9758_006071 [Tetrapyrgos nigripes]|uniref:Uncharacterized protein n=1 Tax=Tetrapyrgos nigripes TaxID=182062 RepID=A0A8H5D843_9AGAR|nr:hypothetical protein D9758_006071 [Tetrapyrgos nigripes]